MVDVIYIIHYTKLTERREHLEKIISESGLDRKFQIIWVTEFDREILTQEIIQENYKYDPNILQRPMTLAEIANGMAHNWVIRKIASENKLALILEDDIVFKPNFLGNIETCLKNVPEDWEAITLGGHYDDGTGYYSNDTDPVDDSFQLVVPRKICTTVSCWLLTSKLAERIVRHPLFHPLKTPIDENLCYILPDVGAKIYWCKPWLAYEGSKTPLFETSMGRGF